MHLIFVALVYFSFFCISPFLYANKTLQNVGVAIEPPNAPQENASDLLNTIGDLLFTFTPAVSKASHNQKNGVGFYDISIGGAYHLEAHFDHFKVGCANGLQNCDIDIDDLSLGRLQPCPKNLSPCYATVREPSLQFAIKNPSQLEKRRLIGVRLLLDETDGALRAGTESLLPNGLNTYSGYIPIQGTHGRAKTSSSYFGNGKAGEEALSGAVAADVLACTNGCQAHATYQSLPEESEGLFVPQLDVRFEIPSFEIYGSHIAAVLIKNIKAFIPDVNFEAGKGSILVRPLEKICVTPALCVEKVKGYFKLTVRGVEAYINFDEALGYIHEIPLEKNPFYIGLQREPLQWPNAKEKAETGWWLSFQKPVDIGYMYTQKLVDMSPMYPSLSKSLSEILLETPVNIDTAGGIMAVTKGVIIKDLGILQMRKPVVMSIKNMPIGHNNPWPDGLPKNYTNKEPES